MNFTVAKFEKLLLARYLTLSQFCEKEFPPIQRTKVGELAKVFGVDLSQALNIFGVVYRNERSWHDVHYQFLFLFEHALCPMKSFIMMACTNNPQLRAQLIADCENPVVVPFQSSQQLTGYPFLRSLVKGPHNAGFEEVLETTIREALQAFDLGNLLGDEMLIGKTAGDLLEVHPNFAWFVAPLITIRELQENPLQPTLFQFNDSPLEALKTSIGELYRTLPVAVLVSPFQDNELHGLLHQIQCEDVFLRGLLKRQSPPLPSVEKMGQTALLQAINNPDLNSALKKELIGFIDAEFIQQRLQSPCFINDKLLDYFAPKEQSKPIGAPETCGWEKILQTCQLADVSDVLAQLLDSECSPQEFVSLSKEQREELLPRLKPIFRIRIFEACRKSLN